MFKKVVAFDKDILKIGKIVKVRGELGKYMSKEKAGIVTQITDSTLVLATSSITGKAETLSLSIHNFLRSSHTKKPIELFVLDNPEWVRLNDEEFKGVDA